MILNKIVCFIRGHKYETHLYSKRVLPDFHWKLCMYEKCTRCNKIKQ